jgi:hypothetical protein
MPTTLKVRNQSGASVVVSLDEGEGTVEIAPHAEVDLEEQFLQTKSFATALEQGRLRFVFTPLRNAEQANLARQLMPRSLRVKNVSHATVTLELDNQSDAIEIAADQEVDLAERFLLTRNFMSAIEAGTLSFVLPISPHNEQYNLARRLMPRLLSEVGSPLIQLHARAKAAKETMQGYRDAYNKSWDAAKTILERGKIRAQAANLLFQSLAHFLNVYPEEALVAQINQEITELEKEDLDATGRTLAKWFVERDQKQVELERAKARLEQAKQDYEQRYQALSEELKSSAKGLAEIDSNQDIGQKLDTSW